MDDDDEVEMSVSLVEETGAPGETTALRQVTDECRIESVVINSCHTIDLVKYRV